MSDIIPGGMDFVTGQQKIIGNTDVCLIPSGQITSPGAGAFSEQFGRGADAVATNATAVGTGALASADNSIAVGQGAQAGQAGDADNISIGTQAVVSPTTSRSVVIGKGAQTALTGSDESVVIGNLAFGEGLGNVVIGGATTFSGGTPGSGTQAYAAYEAVVIGHNAYTDASECASIGSGAIVHSIGAVVIGTNASVLTGADYSVAIGHTSSSSGNNNIAIGRNTIAGFAFGIVIGAGSETTGNNQFVAGSATNPIDNVYFGSGSGAGTAAASNYTINGTPGNATFPNGGTLNLAGGLGFAATDVAGSAIIKTGQTSVANTLLKRIVVNATAKALTSATPVGIISVSVPTGTMAGGQIRCTVRATDTTDFQAVSGVIYWTATNKTGTAVGDASASTYSTTVTAGTLTMTASASVVTTTVTIEVTATTSLTATTFDIQYQAENNSTQDITIL